MLGRLPFSPPTERLPSTPWQPHPLHDPLHDLLESSIIIQYLGNYLNPFAKRVVPEELSTLAPVEARRVPAAAMQKFSANSTPSFNSAVILISVKIDVTLLE